MHILQVDFPEKNPLPSRPVKVIITVVKICLVICAGLNGIFFGFCVNRNYI